MKNIRNLLASISVSVLAVGTAQAQSPVSETGQQESEPQQSAGLNEIIVTAQRRAQRLEDVPLTIAALSGETLDQAGVTTLRDVQNVVSGFTFSGQGTVAQPSIRGVSTLLSISGAENPNALYIDGIYQATQAALGNELPDVERIEVLKGPQGTLFGRNATGGAIQIFTRSPEFTPTASFKLDQGFYTGDGGSRSAPRTSLSAFVAGPIAGDAVAASLAAGYLYTPGYLNNDQTGERDGKTRKVNLRGKILFRPSEDLDITLSGYYVDNQELIAQTTYDGLSAAAVYPGSVVPTRPWSVAYDEDPRGSSTALLEQYGFSGALVYDAEIGTITSLTGYNHTSALNPGTSVHGAYGGLACGFNFACLDYYFAIDNRELSQELNFASRDFGIFSFVTGLYYYNAKGGTVGQIQNYLSPFAPPGTFPITVQDFSFKTEAYAAYGEGTISPSDRLQFIVGLRYSIEPHTDQSFIPQSPVLKRTFRSLTPRLAIRYELTPDLSAYASYSIGYKSGLTGASNTASTPQFASIDPEKIYAYEAGMKYASPNLTLNGSFFYYDYKNKQEQTFTGTSTIVKNTGPVRIYGFDFDTIFRISDYINFRGTASYIPEAKYLDFPDASGSSTTRIPFDAAMPPFNCAPGGGCGGFLPLTFDASGTRLSRTPKVTASGTVSYDDDVFDASATLSYSSAVFHDITGVVRQDAYATITARVGYTVGNARLGVYGRNLTNEAYIVNGLASSAGFLAGYAPPREIGVSVGYDF